MRTRAAARHKPKHCEKCEAEFVPVGNRAKLCETCRLCLCSECGTRFRKGGGRGEFCSPACFYEHRRKHQRVRLKCRICGTEYEVMKSRARDFCSFGCRTKGLWASEDHRKKFAASMRGNPLLKTPQRRAQLDAARSNRVFPADWSERVRAAIVNRRPPPTRNTSIEVALREEFLRRGWAFEMHIGMFGLGIPDFVFPQALLIVQADGDYWHSRPLTAARDKRFDAAAAEAGWVVLRFLGSEIGRAAAACADAVASHLAS